jgi:parvulin-like peptidyl-prolyl isomerase
VNPVDRFLSPHAGLLALLCLGLTVPGCNKGDAMTEHANRTKAETLRGSAAERRERVETANNADTPVSRLFINDDKIEVEDLLRPIRPALSEAAGSLTSSAYSRLLHDRITDEFRRQARTLLLYQEASKRLSAREEELLQGFVDDAVRKRVNGEFEGRQARYERALAEQGLTLLQDRERIRRELVVVRFLQQTVTPRVLDPTRAELVRFFEERKGELSKPERRKMSLIEVPLGDSGGGVNAAAHDAITRAQAELNGGGDFATAARKYSKGLHADEGGAWDWLSRGSVREHWEPAVDQLFLLQAGEISPIVETAEALFIVRCDAIEPAVEPDFEALQPDLVQAYRDLQFNRLVDERVRELQQKAVFVPENAGRFLQAVADAAPKSKKP